MEDRERIIIMEPVRPIIQPEYEAVSDCEDIEESTPQGHHPQSPPRLYSQCPPVLNKEDLRIESAPLTVLTNPEVVLDDQTGLLLRALLGEAKEKEAEPPKAVQSESLELETIQMQGQSIAMALVAPDLVEEETELEIDESLVNSECDIVNIKGLKIAELLYKDQSGGINSLADAHIVCEDGHVPFHRYILMAASSFISELLINEDPSELAVIHIPDVKVVNMVQVLSILYSGKALYVKSEEKDIYKIFRMLGISTDGLQFRNSKPEDGTTLGKLRFYGNECEEDDEFTSADDIMDHGTSSPSLDNASTESSGNEDTSQDNVIESRGIENRGPKVSSRSQIDKAETAKFLSIKMEMAEEDDAIVETDFKIKCRYCDAVHTSEESLSEHLSSFCGSHLVGKYNYSNKQCLGCRRKFPSYSLYGLINHVESCKRLQVAFTATASQFVNGTLPPINVKEETGLHDVELNEDGEMAPASKIAKTSENSKSSRKKQKKGLKKRKPPTSDAPMVAKTRSAKAASPVVECPVIQIVDVSQLVEEERRPAHAQTTERQQSDGEPEVILIDDDECTFGETVKCEATNGYHDDAEEDDCEYVIENNEIFKDIASVPMQDLRLLLTSCPVCKKRYVKLKTASKCLRTHGLRRCWICLKLLAANGQAFLHHNRKYHIIPGTDSKVECSFCKKQFGYNIGINTHMGNYHFSRLLETTTKDFETNEELLTATQMKTLETFNRGLGENESDNGCPDKNTDQNDEESTSNDSDDKMDIDDDSDIEEIYSTPAITPHSSPVIPVTATAASSSTAKEPSPQPRPPPPNLGRDFIEMQNINGILYNIYGLKNPPDHSKKFSKVIAIRNTDCTDPKNPKSPQK